MEYVFTLKYQLAAQDADFDEIVERLGEAGCDDALVGIGQPGRIALEFTREAESAEAALISALANVRQAIPTAKLIEAAPDRLIERLAEIPDLLGLDAGMPQAAIAVARRWAKSLDAGDYTAARATLAETCVYHTGAATLTGARSPTALRIAAAYGTKPPLGDSGPSTL